MIKNLEEMSNTLEQMAVKLEAFGLLEEAEFARAARIGADKRISEIFVNDNTPRNTNISPWQSVLCPQPVEVK